MIKRLTWFTMGAVSGAVATLWALSVARARARALAPAQVAAAVSARARSRLDDVRDALFEARLAMREREAELRAGLDGDAAERSPRPALTVKSSPN